MKAYFFAVTETSPDIQESVLELSVVGVDTIASNTISVSQSGMYSTINGQGEFPPMLIHNDVFYMTSPTAG